MCLGLWGTHRGTSAILYRKERDSQKQRWRSNLLIGEGHEFEQAGGDATHSSQLLSPCGAEREPLPTHFKSNQDIRYREQSQWHRRRSMATVSDHTNQNAKSGSPTYMTEIWF